MDRMPPHGPARGDTGDHDHPPADLPDVAEAVTGRARDLHHLADALSRGADPSGTEPAVALLRAHAGAVGDLARHLRSAGASETSVDEATAIPPTPPTPSSATPRTAP